MKKLFRWSTIRYMLFLVVFTCVACEIILRIYNPFPFRLRGTDILLPRNQRYIIDNSNLPGLDSSIIHTKNSLGFRGAEMPADLTSYFSVLTVGGSTTECWNLQEKDSWPYVLNQKLDSSFKPVWFNNAGFSGHSTFAHSLLINEYIKQLHPKLVFFLVGWNEVSRRDLAEHDDIYRKHFSGFMDFLSKNSELYNLVVNIKRHYQYKEYGKIKDYPYLITGNHDLLLKSDRFKDSVVQAETPLYDLYRKRLTAIVDTCMNNQILPVLITQPGILGNGIEPHTGCNLDDYKLSKDCSGKMFSDILKRYNAVTMAVAREKGILCIDLASQLSPAIANYYDICHYNKPGCKTVAQIVYDQSIAYLKQHFASYLKH